MKLPNLHKLSVKSRLLIGMGAMFVPLLLLSGGALISFETSIGTLEKIDNQSLELLFTLTNLESLIVATTNPVKEYMTNGDEAAQYRFIRKSQEVDRNFAALLATPANLPEQQKLLQASQKQWQQALATGQTIFTYPNPTNNPKAIKVSEQFYARNFQAVSSIDQLHKRLIHFQTTENLNQVKNAKQQVRLIVVLAFLLGLVMAALTSAIVVRSIVSPLSILEKGVARLGNGDFSSRIVLANQDELGQLATAFNLMIEKLKQSQAALKNLATVDELTGAYNRREFNTQLKNEIERSGRYERCFTLLLLDIDHFKKLNDTYGHQAGDVALQTIVALLKQEFRDLDRVARYGGEEFIVILPETSASSAFLVAERIRQIISTYAIAINDKQTISVTVSGGIATFPINGDNGEALIYAADQALYSAKRSGRNQIILCSDLNVKKIS